MYRIKNTVQAIFTGVFALVSFATTGNAQETISTVAIAPMIIAEPGNLDAIKNPEFFQITNVEVEEIEDTRPPRNNMSFLNADDDCASRTTTSRTTRRSDDTSSDTRTSTRVDIGDVGSVLDSATVILDKIVNLGGKVWNILKKSRPVVETATVSANALPAGVRCWYDLERWSAPQSKSYRMTYKNLFGFTVIKFDLRMIYSYGGRFEGKGRYLTNATVDFANLSVAPGMFELNADVVVPDVTNVGTKESPVAAMLFKVNWTARGLNHNQNTVNFVVYGDGRPLEMH